MAHPVQLAFIVAFAASVLIAVGCNIAAYIVLVRRGASVRFVWAGVPGYLHRLSARSPSIGALPRRLALVSDIALVAALFVFLGCLPPQVRRRLTIVGGGRETLLVWRRGRLGTVCARDACPAWSSGPSTSPLGAAMSRLSRAFFTGSFGAALVVGWPAAGSEPSSLEVFVRENGSCIVLSEEIPCKDMGSRLDAAHVPHSDTIVVSGPPQATYEMVGTELQSLQRAGFNVRFPSK